MKSGFFSYIENMEEVENHVILLERSHWSESNRFGTISAVISIGYSIVYFIHNNDVHRGYFGFMTSN